MGENTVTIETSLIGTFEGTDKDLYYQLIKVIPNGPASKILELAKLYVKWGEEFNLRADIAWAQMEHETNYLRYGGDVKPEQNNFAGIGATGGVPGNSFKTMELGVIAHFAHLAWYVYPDHINKYCCKCYDPRHFGELMDKTKVHPRHKGDELKYLSEAWAVGAGGYHYSEAIAKIANTIFIGVEMISPVENFWQKVKDKLKLESAYKWEFIAVHHSVSDQFKTTMEMIRTWHMHRIPPFLREGYNYGVCGDGRLDFGRPLTMAGAHVLNFNKRAIGVCLYGDFRHDKLTKEQKTTAFKLFDNIRLIYEIPITKILGHGEFNALGSHNPTSCPCLDMGKFRYEYLDYIQTGKVKAG